MIKRVLFLYLFSMGLCGVVYSQDFAHMVNPFIGTKGLGLASGYLYPGATYPHGMVQFTPTYFSKSSGFVINQTSGGGCEHEGNFPMFPLKGHLTTSPDIIRNARIEVTREEGYAGYYKAHVQDDVVAELTVTERTGMAKIGYPEDVESGTVIIGTGIAATPISHAAAVVTSRHSCEGYAEGGNFCGLPTPYRVYFAAEFSEDAVEVGTWKRDIIHREETFAEGARSGIYFTFKSPATLLYKIGISYVSVENARENLKAENNGWNFDAIRNHAEAEWNKYLGMIEVEGGTNDRMTQFYTHLYRSFIHPNVCSDVNGEYMGADHLVHKTRRKQYTNLSNWDTYRTQIQLLSVLEPQTASDIVLSHLDFAQQGGGSFPRWVMANIETGIMQGDPSSILVSNAWAFGARNYDPKPLLEVMRRGAEVPGAKCQGEETRPGLQQYLDKHFYNASQMLEYTSADFAIGQFALRAVGDEFLSWKYFDQARWWRNLYNPETGWLQSKDANGAWKPLSEDFREATYQDYFWMVPYDYSGLIELCGGADKAEKRLDDYFVRLDAGYNDIWFASGNEPSFGTPWVYNWVGKPWKAQRIIRRILDEQYNSSDDGLPGNDDLGTMGAWYVFACLGLYPSIPGIGGFTLSTPLFPKATLHLPYAKKIVISGGSEKTPYIASLKLNGKNCNRAWIDWKDLSQGATLIYSTKSTPVKGWAMQNLPPSFK